MRSSTLSLALFVAASTATSLWQPLEMLKRELEPLRREIDLYLPLRQKEKRQETTTKFNLSFTGAEGQITSTSAASTAASGDSQATTTASGDSTRTTGDSSNTSGDSGNTSGGTKTTAKSSNRKSGDSQTTKTFDNRLPAGGLSMVTPNPFSTQFYKIDDWVTFAWNYTSVSVMPSHIDVLASCSANSATYTIALNQTVEPTQTILWDTRAYQANATISLLTETYTLIVHDANQAISASPRAGYFGTYDQFTFGMYVPQPYTPMNEFVCATCNAAFGSLERNNLFFLFGMAAMTVLSFGWFAGIAGLW